MDGSLALMPSKYQDGIIDALQNLAIEHSWNDGADSRLLIVVHIRQTDGMKHPMSVYASAVAGLKSVEPGAHIILHSDGPIEQGTFPEDVEFKGGGADIVDVLKDFIRADLFVASRSSFSLAAEYFTLGRPVLSWTDPGRPGLVNLPGLHVLGIGEENTDPNFYRAIATEAWAWKHKAAGKTGSKIWKSLSRLINT